MTATNLVPFDNNVRMPAILEQHLEDADDLTSGVSGGFAVVSIRGSKWRIKYQGEEIPVLNGEGDPVSTLEVVLLKANKNISKNFYDAGYEEGAADAPTCFSLDGITPDDSVQTKISETCAKCPKNVFGSRITPAGKKAKACSDNRRMAIAPLGDLMNETFGGPMLLRVPAASLADLKMFGETLKRRGFAYNAVAVRLGFDMETSYPKLTFRAIRVLTDDEATIVASHLQGDVVQRILATAGEVLHTPSAAELTEAGGADPVFEEAPSVSQEPKPTVARTAAAKPAPAVAKPQPGVAATSRPAAAQPAKTATFGGGAAKPAAQPAPAAKPAPARPVAVAKPKPAPAPAPVQQEVLEGEVLEATGDDPSSALDAEIDGILSDLDSMT